MEFDRYEDRGTDLKRGDFVFIKFELLRRPTTEWRLQA